MTLSRTSLIAAIVVTAAVARAGDIELKSEEDKTLYALGVAASRNLAPLNLTAAELELVKAGLSDALLHKPSKVNADAFSDRIHQLVQARAAAVADAEKQRSEPFLTKASQEKGAKKTASGLIYSEITAGTGASPKPTDKVKVHYHGTLIDGTVFDSSVQRGQPLTLPLNGVIPCWTEGMQLMKVGGKSKLVCPSNIAYGDRGSPPRIKPGATLIFEVELLYIVK